jgi:hypothetical protein
MLSRKGYSRFALTGHLLLKIGSFWQFQESLLLSPQKLSKHVAIRD